MWKQDCCALDLSAALCGVLLVVLLRSGVLGAWRLDSRCWELCLLVRFGCGRFAAHLICWMLRAECCWLFNRAVVCLEDGDWVMGGGNVFVLGRCW